MSATTLERPRPIVAQRKAPPATAPPTRPRPRFGRAVTPLALVASALVHVLLLNLRFHTEPPATVASPATREFYIEIAPGMRVLDIAPVQADVPTPQVVATQRVFAPVQPVVTAPAGATAAAGATGTSGPVPARPAARTVGERLAPRGADPRLWAIMPDPLNPGLESLSPGLEPLNNVRARVYAEIALYNDSLAAAAAAAGRSADWTVRDRDGGRWGISPAGIHLGTITLPLPLLGTSAAQRATMQQWNETQQQASRAQVEQSFDDRVRAIRARKDAARDSARRGGGS